MYITLRRLFERFAVFYIWVIWIFWYLNHHLYRYTTNNNEVKPIELHTPTFNIFSPQEKRKKKQEKKIYHSEQRNGGVAVKVFCQNTTWGTKVEIVTKTRRAWPLLAYRRELSLYIIFFEKKSPPFKRTY